MIYGINLSPGTWRNRTDPECRMLVFRKLSLIGADRYGIVSTLRANELIVSGGEFRFYDLSLTWHVLLANNPRIVV